MKKNVTLLFLFLMILTVLSPVMKVFALEDGQTELEEIVITGEILTESLVPGPLPSYEVETSTPHVSIEAYGDNTNWSYLDNGVWHGFGDETPTAEEGGPFYAMKLCVNLSDGYVFTENTKIIYNTRNMSEDTYSSITAYDWGGYVYIDLGQINAPGPDIEGNVIKRVDITVDMPRIGDNITMTDGFQTQYGVNIREENLDIYGPDGDDTHNYMYIVDTNGDFFEGKLQANTDYDMIIWLVSFEDYVFDDNLEIYVNGDFVDQYNLESDQRLGIDYVFQPEAPDVTYTITAEGGKYIAVFSLPEGYDFELDVVDILSYTPEQIEAMFDVPAETIEEIIATIKENVKEYGELLNLYAIDISGPGIGYSDAVTIKILLTDEMKKYDTLKFIFVDENNNFVIQEIHDSIGTETIDGKEYVVFELNHLSAYALVGSNTNNPGTADKVIYYAIMLGLCTLGLAGLGIYTKKKYFIK
ncbi:MAG: hypothetical protein J6X28_01715 [Bacilli bacterium]|nr:hypothetical protein [Bacilli bacterium]